VGYQHSSLSLSEKQAEFVRQLPLCGFDPVKAYNEAGYTEVSEKRAQQIANNLLQQDKIREALAASWHGHNGNSGELTVPRVLKEIARIAFADMREILDWEKGALQFRPAREMSDDAVAAIASVVITDKPSGTRTVSVRTWDKLKALDMAARHLGMYEKDNVHTLEVNYTTELPAKASSVAEWSAANSIETESREIVD